MTYHQYASFFIKSRDFSEISILTTDIQVRLQRSNFRDISTELNVLTTWRMEILAISRGLAQGEKETESSSGTERQVLQRVSSVSFNRHLSGDSSTGINLWLLHAFHTDPVAEASSLRAFFQTLQQVSQLLYFRGRSTSPMSAAYSSPAHRCP
jgi:hypothetical protein